MAKAAEKLKSYIYNGNGKHWVNETGPGGSIIRRPARKGERLELTPAAFEAFKDRFVDPEAPSLDDPDAETETQRGTGRGGGKGRARKPRGGGKPPAGAGAGNGNGDGGDGAGGPGPGRGASQ